MKRVSMALVIVMVLIASTPIFSAMGDSIESLSEMSAEIDEETLIEQVDVVLNENALAVQSIRKHENVLKHRTRILGEIEERIEIPYHRWPVSVRYCADRYFYDNGWGFLYENKVPISPGEEDTTEEEAILIAKQFLIKRNYVTESELDTYLVHRLFFFRTVRNRNEWGIEFYIEKPEDEEYPFESKYYVTIVSETGEVDTTSFDTEGNG